MLTGSMAPAIESGDVAVVTPVPVSRVRPGHVLTFQAPTEDHRVLTHRVVEVLTAPDGAVSIRTKGDANAAADPWVARPEEPTVWRVRAVVPGLGDLIRTLRQPVVRRVLIVGVPLALAGWMLAGVWRPRQRRQEGA
jgi:signal peptidase